MNLSKFNQILTQTLLLPVLALAFVAGILVWQVRNAERTVSAIQASGESIAAATRAEKLIVDEETGLRGYQLTSDPRFLKPYRDAAQPLHAELDLLRRNLIAHGESTRPVEAMEAREQLWRVSFADQVISTIDGGGDTRDTTLNLEGQKKLDDVRTGINDIVDRETALRSQEVGRWRLQVRRTIEALIVLALASGIFISVFSLRQLHRVSDAYQGTLDGLRHHAQATFDSEERLRTTLTSIGDGVIVCDPGGCVELLNSVAQELTGWTQNDAFRRPLEEVFHILNETTREQIETPVAMVKRLNRVVGLANHTVLVRKDGTEINIDDSGAPIHDRNGALSGIVMVFRDITRERRAQNALLATEKLAVAGRLAATIAHEMHNPLDSVSNLLYLLRGEKDPNTAEHYLTLAQQELTRMGQVSRAMLGLYREAKNPVTINIKEMLDGVIVLLERPIQQRQLTIETAIPDHLEVHGFPAELRQVFTNLLANAAEATASGGKLILAARATSVKTLSSATAHRGVTIQVCDTGSGIEPEALEHIFEPFFTTKGELGTGLGLWFSRGIVDKHGGSIEIHSSSNPEDHGTTITVFLPHTGPATTQT